MNINILTIHYDGWHAREFFKCLKLAPENLNRRMFFRVVGYASLKPLRSRPRKGKGGTQYASRV